MADTAKKKAFISSVTDLDRIRFFTLAGMIVAAILLGWQSDDSYHGYVMVKHLIEGNGFVYNIGERACATTSPLYTLSVAIPYLFTREMFFTSLFLDVFYTAIAYYIFAWKFCRSKNQVLYGFLALIGSKAFLSYTTSGLENSLLFLLSAYVLTYPKFKDFDMMGAFLPFIYVGIMLSYIYRIRALEHGIVLVYLVFVSSWVNDVFAYLVGRTIGKHKLSPILSPKKSIEGFFGGIAGAALFGCIFGAVFNKFVAATDLAILKFAVIGAVGAIPAVIGDLAASAIKRNHDIKDYGKLIPGHGGIMDRFDSAIFTAPIVYYLLTLVWGF